MADRRNPALRGYSPSGPPMREQDIVPRYEGRIQGGPSMNNDPADLARGLEMSEENRMGTYMDDLNERRRIVPRRLKEGGKVRGDGCAMKGRTKGRMV